MKKNILIIIFILIATLSLTGAFIKADEATKIAMEAELAQQVAVQNAEEAAVQKKIAEMRAAEARAAADEAERIRVELGKCQSR